MSTHIDYEINKELGECYLFTGDFEKAETYYQKAATVAPEQADAYLGIATVAMQKGDLDLAEANYAKANDIQESDRAIAGLGLIAMQKEMHEEAFARFKQALKLNSGNMVALNCIVQEGYFLDRLEDIIPYLRAAIDAGTTESVRYALAGCLTVLGRDEEARQELELLLGVNPDNKSARELYARIAA